MLWRAADCARNRWAAFTQAISSTKATTTCSKPVNAPDIPAKRAGDQRGRENSGINVPVGVRVRSFKLAREQTQVRPGTGAGDTGP